MVHNKDYKGEVPSKKMTRLTFWLLIRQHLGTKRFLAGPHLVLASREAGDVSVLLGMGVDIKNIIGVDYVPHEAAQARLKFPGLRVIEKEIGLYAREYKGLPFASIYLDFCSQSGNAIFDTVSLVIKHLVEDDGLLGYNFMVGREQSVRHKAAKYRREIEAQIARMKKTRRADMEGMAVHFSRAFLMESEIVKRVKSTPLQLEAHFFYSSKQEGHIGHPWCGQLVRVNPSKPNADSPDCYYFSTDMAALRDYALSLEKKTGQAALLLNVTRTTMAAWKAHASRGTYAKHA